MKLLRVTGIAAALTLLVSVPCVTGADWKDDLKAKVLEGVTITKVGSDRLRITEPGTVFIFQKDGVSGNLSSDLTLLRVSVTDGKIAQASGFLAAVSDKKSNRDFKQGERVYLYQGRRQG